MSVRRRTVFAAPFIVVGCGAKDPPKDKEPPRFPGVTWNVRMENMECVAREPGPNPPPPRAIECPPGISGTVTFTIGQLAADRCGIVPAGCLEPGCVKLPTPCPLPPGEKLKTKLSNVWLVEKEGATCHAEEGDVDDCPPGTDCNPPRPRIVPCPPGITEGKPVRVAELVNGTCVAVPYGCYDTSCIGEKIACPTE